MPFKEISNRHIAYRLAHISCRAKLVAREIIYIGLSLPFAHIYIAVIAAKPMSHEVLVLWKIYLISVFGYIPILVRRYHNGVMESHLDLGKILGSENIVSESS